MRKIFKHEPKTMWKWCKKLFCFCITCTELTCRSLPAILRPKQDMNAIAPKELRDHFIKNQHLVKLSFTINR